MESAAEKKKVRLVDAAELYRERGTLEGSFEREMVGVGASISECELARLVGGAAAGFPRERRARGEIARRDREKRQRCGTASSSR